VYYFHDLQPVSRKAPPLLLLLSVALFTSVWHGSDVGAPSNVVA